MLPIVKTWVERSIFGVCAYLGEKMGVATHRVRLYFIYLTCAALGSPVLIYLALAFWVNIRKYLRSDKRHSSMDV